MNLDSIMQRLRMHQTITQTLTFRVQEVDAKREQTKTDEKTKAKVVVKPAESERFYVQFGYPTGYRVTPDMDKDQADEVCAALHKQYAEATLAQLEQVTRTEILAQLG